MSSDPVLHLLAGPNGSGKTTFYDRVLAPVTGLPFINADVIAAERWPGEESAHAYEASDLAASERERSIVERRSFVSETMFSHRSKLELIGSAHTAGFHITLHIMLIPEELAVARVVNRVEVGGQFVPEQKVRERFHRLWGLLPVAITWVDHATVYDNSRAATPYVPVARYIFGRAIEDPRWPAWTPPQLFGE